jgi:hypothetical protein
MHVLRNWSRTKLALLLGAALLLSLFFLSWFMQTVWLSSVVKDNSLSTAVWAYSQLGCSFLLAIFAAYVGVRLWKGQGGHSEV